ncbi:MAG TPA: response regulator [Myxococcota bacterium]|nr:response regulator [Myxococcota bacterium]
MPVRSGDGSQDGGIRGGNSATDPVRGTVVLLDDDAWYRQGLRRPLQHEGCAVFEAEDISSFLRLLETHHVDVVVVDSVLGDNMDGWKEVRAVATRYPGMQIVYVSGYDKESILCFGGTPVERHYIKGRDGGHAIVQAVIDLLRG